MASDVKLRVHLPFECLFDLRWGFIRAYSNVSDLDLFPKFNTYCIRLTDNLSTIVPEFKETFRITPEVVRLAPRTAILTLLGTIFRQFEAERPDDRCLLHITIDYDGLDFVPTETRKIISEMTKGFMIADAIPTHVNNVNKGYDHYTIKSFRKNFELLVVYDIDRFINTYNTRTRMAYDGFGIITRPLFIEGKTPEQFRHMIETADKRSVNGESIKINDHYEILSDAFSHIGPIYFHEPQYFSAILPE